MKIICFDMDGVIFKHSNFWIELHKAWGTLDEGLELTKQYLKTNYPKLVQEVIGRLWKGKPESVFLELVRKGEYLPDVKETIKSLKGYHLVIITSGPKQLGERAKEIGFDEVYANEVTFEEGKCVGSTDMNLWPIRDDSKVQALRDLASKHLIDLKDIIVVGHGKNDIPMMKVAGFSIALNPESEEIAKSANVVVNGSIKNILRIIEER